jgi:tetratricopeptide (TPR) repeat protein
MLTIRRERGLPQAGILLAVCLCAVASARAECKAPPALEAQLRAHPTAKTYTALGTWFGDHHQFDCSTKAFRSALKLDPHSAKLAYFLGLSIYSSGDVQGAVEQLRQSIALDAKAIRPRLLLATILHQLGPRSEAEAQWRAVLQVDPASIPALDGLSQSLIDSGDVFVAIDLLEPAVAAEGDHPSQDLIIDLALAYGLAATLDKAAALLQPALAADPSSMRLTHAMTTVLVKQRRYQDAVALTRKYLDQHPDDLQAQIEYLSTLVLDHDTTTARPLGEKLLTIAPHDFHVLQLNATLEHNGGNDAAARDHLEEAIKQQPENYDLHLDLGTALTHLDDPADAKRELVKAISLDNSQAQAHYQLAGVLRALGETEAAREQLRIYKQLSDASSARTQSDSQAKVAAHKLADGDVSSAVALFKEAVQATPDDALLQYQLSTALDRAGDTTAERAALEQAVKIDPTFALAQNQLGYLASQGGETANAEKAFQAAVASAPQFTDAWINLAATLAQEGRIPEAQQAAATALRLDPNNEQAQQLSRKLNEAAHR